MAIKYYVAGSGGTNNFGTTGAGSNWSGTSGGAGGQTPPTAVDDIIIDANSPALLIIDTSARACKSITTTGWTGTIQMNQVLSVSGNVTLTSNTTITGAQKLEVIAASTITFGGCYIPVFGLRGAVTHTLADDGTVEKFWYGSTTNNTVMNGTGRTLTCMALEMQLSSTGTLSGTAEIVIGPSGACYISPPTSTGVLRNILTINTTGTVSTFTGTLRYNTGTLRHIAGTVDTSRVDLLITTANTTLDCGSAVVWQSLTITGTIAVTFTSNCHVSGLVSLGGTTLTTTINGADIYAGGGFTLNGTTAVVSGSADVILSGTGLFTVNTTTSIHNFDLIIDAGAGTITTGTSNMRFPFDRIQYLSGTVITSAGTWSTSGGTTGATLLMGGTGQTGIGVF